MVALAVEGVTVRYGARVALSNVDLAIGAGAVVAVLGANGAGKSTLVAVAAGLLAPDAGRVLVTGVDVRRDPLGARRRLGVAGQEVGLYPTETVGDNLRLFGALAGLRGPSLAARVAEVAEAIGLADSLDRRADRCSAGERRRAHVAAALLHRPSVLVLDEPAAHLDLDGRRALLGLARAAADDGAAVCWCTNQPEEAAALAGTVAILEWGRLLAKGSPSELARALAQPTVEVRFAGPVPPLPSRPGLELAGDVARLAVTGPATAVDEALAVIGSHLGRVRSLRVVEPDLQAAFVAVIGQPGADDDVAVRPGG